MLPDDNAYLGQQDQTTDLTGFNALSFITWQILRSISGARLVKIMAVTSTDDVAPVGFVDAQPLVNQLDGSDQAVPHGTIYHLPFFRLQGGANAVIIDPKVGDIGVAVIEDRDISSAKANRGFANPGSKRIFDMADGLYIGGFLNGAPQQYVRFSADGVEIVSPTQIRMAAPSIVLQATETVGITAGQQVTNSAPIVEIDGQLAQGEGPLGGNATMQGPLIVTQDVTAAGTSVHGHTHPGVEHGDASTGAPN